MAQWQRDEELRRRLSWLLAAAEVLALSVNFYFVFSAYAYQLDVRLNVHFAAMTMYAAIIACLVLCAAGTGYVALMYTKGRAWARWVLIAENAALILMGVMWFLHNRFISESPDRMVVRAGLVLPMVTLFPLLWPLLTLRPNLQPGAG